MTEVDTSSYPGEHIVYVDTYGTHHNAMTLHFSPGRPKKYPYVNLIYIQRAGPFGNPKEAFDVPHESHKDKWAGKGYWYRPQG